MPRCRHIPFLPLLGADYRGRGKGIRRKMMSNNPLFSPSLPPPPFPVIRRTKKTEKPGKRPSTFSLYSSEERKGRFLLFPLVFARCVTERDCRRMVHFPDLAVDDERRTVPLANAPHSEHMPENAAVCGAIDERSRNERFSSKTIS